MVPLAKYGEGDVRHTSLVVSDRDVV